MIGVEEASRLLDQYPGRFGSEKTPIADVLGRVLREDLIADRDFPPFDRVTMDGIGVDHTTFHPEKRYTVEGVAPAGSAQVTLKNREHCLEVMTGAITPHGVTAVVKYEDTERIGDQLAINLPNLQYRQNIHGKGSDRAKGDTIVKAGSIIGSAEIGIAATVGKHTLLTSRMPRVLVVSTGDELVPIEQTPAPHQIRSSNSSMIAAALRQHVGLVAATAHLTDDSGATEELIERNLAAFDVLIFLGGSSRGKFDFVPAALQRLGVTRHFYKVAQRPGKPFWFGSKTGACAVFALPGNPVSCLLCLTRYVIPWLRKGIGLPTVRKEAMLSTEVTFRPDLTYFAQVAITQDKDGTLAVPVEGHGSGDLANLCDASAFLELPPSQTVFDQGASYPYYSYR
ncbi:MAG: molybdopterin molybdotransferase MoeA [Saprospiraceae bacterium]|nr:molybdopterin molybdotransferase MoeA [Saprospiraceae bacterium]